MSDGRKTLIDVAAANADSPAGRLVEVCAVELTRLIVEALPKLKTSGQDNHETADLADKKAAFERIRDWPNTRKEKANIAAADLRALINATATGGKQKPTK
jgi:hypothetical protein